MSKHFLINKLEGSRRIYLSVTYLLILLFSSCEKVIELKLKDAGPVIVIDGNITDQSENQIVKVSKIIPFDKPNTFNGLAGAKVTVTTSVGQVINFAPATAGVYRSPRFRGVSGLTYKLEVTVEGKVYSATSTMPNAVNLDSIKFKKLSIFGRSRIYPAVYYVDPAQIQNQYRYIIRVNSKPATEQVTEDRFNDGRPTSELITFDGDGIVSGDKVEVEMQCIDRNVFKYYFAITQIDGNGGPPVAPSNPESNLNNGALGIFSAHTKTNLSVTLK